MKKYHLKKMQNTSRSSQIIEIKFQNMLKEIFTSLRSIELCIKKEKNKQTKYNTADQIVDMQAVNFVLMKHN